MPHAVPSHSKEDRLFTLSRTLTRLRAYLSTTPLSIPSKHPRRAHRSQSSTERYHLPSPVASFRFPRRPQSGHTRRTAAQKPKLPTPRILGRRSPTTHGATGASDRKSVV